MKTTIITGPRVISIADEQLVRAVVREVIARGYHIYAGNAQGVDDLVYRESMGTKAAPHIFYSVEKFVHTLADLAERSTCMVQEALNNCFDRGPAREQEIICIGFSNKSCPAGIAPVRSWRAGEPGSGTWSTIALATGHNIETWIFPLHSSKFSEHAGFPKPFLNFKDIAPWPQSFAWENFATNHVCSAAAWHFTPAPNIFEVQP